MNWVSALFTHPATMIALGGAIGSNARYWFGRGIKTLTGPTDFPWATMIVNISGSIVLGLVAAWASERTSKTFLFWGTGICGGYTTFSTFALESVEAIKAGKWWIASLYLFSSVVGGMLGFFIATLFVGDPE